MYFLAEEHNTNYIVVKKKKSHWNLIKPLDPTINLKSTLW